MFQLLNLWPVKSFISSPQFCFSTESQSHPFFLAAVRLRALRRTDRHQAWQSHRWSIQKMVKLDQGIRMSSKQRKAANLHLLLGVKGWTSLFSNDFPCHNCGLIPKTGELGSDGPFPVFWLQGHGGKPWNQQWFGARQSAGRNSRAPKSLNTGRVGCQTGDFDKTKSDMDLIWIYVGWVMVITFLLIDMW